MSQILNAPINQPNVDEYALEYACNGCRNHFVVTIPKKSYRLWCFMDKPIMEAWPEGTREDWWGILKSLCPSCINDLLDMLDED